MRQKWALAEDGSVAIDSLPRRELYQIARRYNIHRRSAMSAGQLREAVKYAIIKQAMRGG